MKNWVSPFNPAELRNKIEEYDLMASEPDFWNDSERSQKILQEAGALKNKLADYERVVQSYEDACTLLEMALEENDESLLEELDQEVQDFKSSYENYRLKALLCEEFACTPVGRRRTVTRWTCWTIRKETRRESSP